MGEVTKNFTKFGKLLRDSIEKSVKTYYKSVEPLILQATPKDTGALRASLRFSKIESSATVIEYKFHFGQGLVGADGQPYASIVHEWPETVNWTTPGTGPNFLLHPVMATAGDLGDIIKLNAKRIKL